MARRKAKPSGHTELNLNTKIKFVGQRSDALDPSTLAKQPTSLQQWFSDSNAVAQFSVPVPPQP